jgi:hypothetical protein
MTSAKHGASAVAATTDPPKRVKLCNQRGDFRRVMRARASKPHGDQCDTQAHRGVLAREEIGRKTLLGKVHSTVELGATIYTDEWKWYDRLGEHYAHFTIRHRDRSYAVGHIHTQTVEGFFSLVKNAIRGVHHGVSEKWLQGYLNEYTWRYNHRGDPEAMFRKLLLRAAATD